MSFAGLNADVPPHGSRIEDYALIGDCRTGALVSRWGSVDWLCWPNFASGACFAALLGTRDHGHWQVAPAQKGARATRQYWTQTMVLDTLFETEEGEVRLTDFMPPQEDGQGRDNSRLVRVVTGVSGKVAMRGELTIRFDYGRTVPWVSGHEGELWAVAGPERVTLRVECAGAAKVPIEGAGLSTVSEFTVAAGETVCFVLSHGSSLGPAPPPIDAMRALGATETFWREWAGRSSYRGPFADAVERSLMTLKALIYQPSGGIVAALTTSLPEQIGGGRNWDYRYCWLRDTAFTLLVLMGAGYTEEAVAWRRWLLRAVAGAPDQVQTIYGLHGERQLPEWTAEWLPGYEGSLPVRIGNGAVDQFQLDVFGEVAEAMSRTPDAEGEADVSSIGLQTALLNHLCKVWSEPDDGIWEVRGPRKHFTHSKVMAWVALDRSIEHMERFPTQAVDLERWKTVRGTIHREICERGFDKSLNSFVQSFGSKELDASCLQIVMVGFLSPEDPRIVGTVEAIQKHLMRDGFVLRYDTTRTDDGLKGEEGAFLACSFWLATNLWLIGRHGEAKELFERLLARRNDVGLLSEEWDVKEERMLGNFPQALSHLAMTHAAFALSGEWVPERRGSESV